MFERKISTDDVRQILSNGEVVEEYPEDKPFPSRLILGWRGPDPTHVVVADNKTSGERIIITVYEPEPTMWEADFKRRRK
jgi:hypothetical protein